MIPLPLNTATMRIVGAALAVVAVFGAGWTVRAWRADAEMAALKQSMAQQQTVAVQFARAEEQRQQGKINEALKRQNEQVAAVNAGLHRDLDELRHRPERAAGVPQGTRPDCAGGTGAELSRPDAGFLAGEAARADLLRAALATCYEVIDARMAP